MQDAALEVDSKATDQQIRDAYKKYVQLQGMDSRNAKIEIDKPCDTIQTEYQPTRQSAPREPRSSNR